jgi:hypothetical protein
MEIADGFRLELPWAAWTYALLLLGGAYWLWRSEGRGPVVFLGVLHLLELFMLLFVFRTAEQAPPPALFVVFVVVTLAGTAAAAAALALTGRRLPT